MTQSKSLFPMVVLFLMVITVRAVYVLILHFGFEIKVDDDFYDEIASNLYAGYGFVLIPDGPPILFRYPGYPYFLAALYAVFGESYWVTVGGQWILDVGTISLMYKISLRIFERRAAVLTVVLCAVYPFTAVYVLRYATEPLFAFLLAAAVLSYMIAMSSGRTSRYILAGVIFSAAVWCRASFFYFLFVLPIVAYFVKTSRKPSTQVMSTTITVVVALLLLIPWGVRNYQATGEFTLLGTAGGYSLWVGSSLMFDGRDVDELPPEEQRLFSIQQNATAGGDDPFSPEAERRFLQAAIQGWLDAPAASAWLILRKGWRFWFSIYNPENRIFQPALIAIQSVILFVGLYGVFAAIRDRRALWLPLLLVLYFNVMHAAVVATVRYSLPIMPYVIMFAAYGVSSFRTAADASHRQRTEDC